MYDIMNLTLSVNNKTILKNIDVSIPKGKITAIIGPNGAGKSTLVKALAGLCNLKKNAVFYNGIGINEFTKNQLARRRSFLSQKPNNAFAFPVEEIVMMGRYPYFNGRPNKIDYEKVAEAIKYTGLEHLRKRASDSLSGGELQRVHFARVLSQCLDQSNKLEDKLIILDEPANNLDPKYQYELLSLIQDLTNKLKLTTVMVMHDLNHTANYADHVILLKNGSVINTGKVQEVLTPDQLEQTYDIPFNIEVNTSGQYFIQCYHRIKQKI